MFAVTSGTADVFKEGEHRRNLGPGDVFGEIAVFFGGVRTATHGREDADAARHALQGELARLEREVPQVTDRLRATVADRLGVA